MALKYLRCEQPRSTQIANWDKKEASPHRKCLRYESYIFRELRNAVAV